MTKTKARSILFYSVMFFLVVNTAHSALLMPLIRADAQSNVLVKANFENPITTPIHLTNLLSNTNLFSFDDCRKIADANRRYSAVTNIISVEGLTFVKTNRCYFVSKGRLFEGRYEKGPFTNYFAVAVHSDSVTENTVEIAEPQYPGYMHIRIRSREGDGYNLHFARSSMTGFTPIKNNLYDGIFVHFKKPQKHTNPEQCEVWTRFKSGKSAGDFLIWNGKGVLVVWGILPDGFDFIGNCVDNFDLDWRCD